MSYSYPLAERVPTSKIRPRQRPELLPPKAVLYYLDFLLAQAINLVDEAVYLAVYAFNFGLQLSGLG